MAKTKVKKDIYSLYFRTDGRVYRPIMCKWYHASHHMYLHDHGEDTAYILLPNGMQQIRKTYFNEGDEVQVYAKHGSVSSIRKDGIKEFWFNHGSYYDKITNKPNVPSEDLWAPSLVTHLFDEENKKVISKYKTCPSCGSCHVGFITRKNKIAIECTNYGCNKRGPEGDTEAEAIIAWENPVHQN